MGAGENTYFPVKTVKSRGCLFTTKYLARLGHGLKKIGTAVPLVLMTV